MDPKDAPKNNDPDNQDNSGGGTPPAKPPATPPATAAAEVDLTKLPQDQLVKVLENPELFKLPRIKELLDASGQLKKLQKEKAEADEASLTEQKKFKELAEKRGTDLEAAQGQIKDYQIRLALVTKLAPAGVVDLEAALKLVDTSDIKIDESGQVTGIDEAVEALKKEKTYLFKPGGGTNVGSPTNQTEGDQVTFKRSQLQNTEFYNENREAILKAHKEGRIIDDIGPGVATTQS